MVRDCTPPAQRSPTRQNDATLRLDRPGEDDTLLLGEHSYDNFLDGLDDDVSFAVPKFSDRYGMRENRHTAPTVPKAAEPLALRVIPTHHGRGTASVMSQCPPNFALEPNVEKTSTRTAETRVAAEQAGKENAFLTSAPAAPQYPSSSLISTSRTLNTRPQGSNISKIPVFAPTVSSADRLAQAFSAFDSLDDQLNDSVSEKQHTQAIKPTIPSTSRIPAAIQMQMPINTTVAASQPSVAKTLREDYTGDGVGHHEPVLSRDSIEESQPDCQAARQTPVTIRPRPDSAWPGNVSEAAFPDRSYVNGAPRVSDANQNGDYEEHAAQSPSPPCDDTTVLPSSLQPPIEPTVSSGLVGDRFGKEQIYLSDLAHDSVTPRYHQSRSIHQYTGRPSTYDIPGPGNTAGTHSSPSFFPKNLAEFPETTIQVAPTPPVSRKKSVGGRRSTIPDWVHFVETGGSGRDDPPFSAAAPVLPSAPIDVIRRRPSASNDHLDDIQDEILHDLPTAPLVDEDRGRVGLNGPQDGKQMAETGISNTSTLPNMPSLCPQFPSARPAASQADFQMDSAESSSTNPITLDSAEPLRGLTIIAGVGIEIVDSHPQRLNPAATAANPTKKALASKASASKLAARTKPIRDIAPKPRVVSNPERARPKSAMCSAPVGLPERPHTKMSTAAGRDRVRGGPKAAPLVSAGANVERVPPVPTVASSAGSSSLPPTDMAEQGSRGNGSLGLRHLPHPLSDVAESNSRHSLSRSFEGVLQHASPPPVPTRNPSMDQDRGTDLSMSGPPAQAALAYINAEAAIQNSINRTPQRESPILDSQMPVTAAEIEAIAKPILSDQRNTAHGASLISRHPHQQRDRATSQMGPSAQRKPFKTTNKTPAIAHPRPKPGVFTHSSKTSISRQQPGSQELHARPKAEIGGQVVDNSAVPVAQHDPAAAHSEPNVAPQRRHAAPAARGIPEFSQPAEEHAEFPGGGATTSYPQVLAHEVPLPESSEPPYQSSPSHASPSSAPYTALRRYVPPVNSQALISDDVLDSAAGDKQARPDPPLREKPRAKKTRIESEITQGTVPFPLLHSQRPHIAGGTIHERAKGQAHVEIEPHMANAEPEMVPLVVKKGKRKSLDNIDDGNHRKRTRTHGRDPRRIVSHNILEPSAQLRRPPRGPVHLPIVQPLAAPVPGEASRLRALEREKRLAESEKERHEKRVGLQNKMRLLDLSQPSNQPTSSKHTCSAPEGPFIFATDHRAEQHRANFEARLAHWEIRTQEAMRQAQPRVAGRPIIPDFAAAQAEHTERILVARQAARTKVTEPHTPGLKTKRRIVQRREFEEQLKDKEHQLQLLREEQQAEAEEMERLRVKQLRKQLDDNVRANPVPKWYKVHDGEDDILILEHR